MKSAAFALERPTRLADALTMAGQLGGAARFIAGGQSLLPAMALRMACPDVVIDLAGLSELRGVHDLPGSVRVGALTTYRQAEHDPLLRRHVPLLARALPWIAHPAIRNAGTLGGSVALADPAAEMPAVCLALDATLVVQGQGGERRVKAEDFFRGLYETALAEGELLLAIEFPKARTGEAAHLDEIARRRGDFAIAGLAVAGERAVLFGVSSRPVLLPPDRSIDGIDFFPDLHHSVDVKRHLAQVLLRRAMAASQGARP